MQAILARDTHSVKHPQEHQRCPLTPNHEARIDCHPACPLPRDLNPWNTSRKTLVCFLIRTQPDASHMVSIMEYHVGLVLCDLSVYSKVYFMTHMEVPCYEQFSIEYCAA